MSRLLFNLLHVLIYCTNGDAAVGHGTIFLALCKRLAASAGLSLYDFEFPHAEYDRVRDSAHWKGYVATTDDLRALYITPAGRAAYNAYVESERSRWLAAIARTTRPGEIGHAQVSTLAAIVRNGGPMSYAQDYKTRRVIERLEARGAVYTFAEYDVEAETVRFFVGMEPAGYDALRGAIERTSSRLVGA